MNTPTSSNTSIHDMCTTTRIDRHDCGPNGGPSRIVAKISRSCTTGLDIQADLFSFTTKHSMKIIIWALNNRKLAIQEANLDVIDTIDMSHHDFRGDKFPVELWAEFIEAFPKVPSLVVSGHDDGDEILQLADFTEITIA